VDSETDAGCIQRSFASNRIEPRQRTLSRRRALSAKVCGSGIGSERKKGFHKAGPIFVAGGSAYLTATTFSLPRRKVRAHVPLGERRPSKCQPCMALSRIHLEYVSRMKDKSFDDAGAGAGAGAATSSDFTRWISISDERLDASCGIDEVERGCECARVKSRSV